VKFHAQKQIVKLSRDRYFHCEDMENISLCIFQYLTLYYVINIYNSVFVVEAIFNYEGNMSMISGHEPGASERL
jgi:hypothetical protein